jgi:hypothetical protein
MPISDNPNYPKEHFLRVYEYIIKPACELAKFKPIRADDVVSTNHIALDIIKNIIESDMAICDLSSQNPNVLYELGIRQAFNKPVTLIKDIKTRRIFDIQGFRDLEYDENLRIDNVGETIELLAENLINTFEQKADEVNSLIKLLGITPAKLSERTNISVEGELILNNLSALDKRLDSLEKYRFSTMSSGYSDQKINSDNEIGEQYSLTEMAELKVGDVVEHIRFGKGKVKKILGNSSDLDKLKGDIEFERGGVKRLLLRFAKLHRVL